MKKDNNEKILYDIQKRESERVKRYNKDKKSNLPLWNILYDGYLSNESSFQNSNYKILIIAAESKNKDPYHETGINSFWVRNVVNNYEEVNGRSKVYMNKINLLYKTIVDHLETDRDFESIAKKLIFNNKGKKNYSLINDYSDLANAAYINLKKIGGWNKIDCPEIVEKQGIVFEKWVEAFADLVGKQIDTIAPNNIVVCGEAAQICFEKYIKQQLRIKYHLFNVHHFANSIGRRMESYYEFLNSIECKED